MRYERVGEVAPVENGIGKVDSIKFAAYLYDKARTARKYPNVTKMQKWLYICYGIYFAVYDEELLNEKPEAWEYGPVFRRVYSVQKNDKLGDIFRSFSEEDLDGLSQYNNVIDATLNSVGGWSASKLVNWTHEKDKAWDKTVRVAGKYEPMDNNDIKLDFKGLLKRNEKNSS